MEIDQLNECIQNFKRTYGSTLAQNTYNNLRGYIGHTIQGRIYTSENAMADAQSLTQDVYKYIGALLTSQLIDVEDLDRIMTRLSENAKSIQFLEENQRGIYGLTDKKTVYVNPDLPKNKRTLYLFHELTHACFKDRKIAPYIGDKMRHSTFFGYMTIEEALAQNTAETCYYESIGQQRPAKRMEQDKILPGVKFATNFDYYGLYQPLATQFGRTLRGVGASSKDSDDKILFELNRKALKEDLLESIIQEYQQDGMIDDLNKMFYNMANVYSAKMMSFGAEGVEEKVFDKHQQLIDRHALRPTSEETLNYYLNAINIMKKDEDYRPTRQDGLSL